METVRYDMGTTDHVAVLGPGRVALSVGEIRRVGAWWRCWPSTISRSCRTSLWMTHRHGQGGRPALHPGGKRALHTYDIADLEDPVAVHQLTGLGNPWDLEVVGDYAYVADNTLGLVTLDLADPRAPGLVGEASSGATAGCGGGRWLRLRRGGIAWGPRVRLVDPAQPERVAEVEPGGGIISVAWADDVLWTAAGWAWPPSMCAIRSRRSPWAARSRVMGDGGGRIRPGAFLARWNEVAVYQADLARTTPDAQPDLSALYYPDGTEQRVLTLHNEGAAPLEIAGLLADVEDIEVRVDTLTVPRWVASIPGAVVRDRRRVG